jgi:SNF2 family DNA or RNA helicase
MEEPCVIVSPVMLVNKWREELFSKFGIETLPITSPEEMQTAEEEFQYAKQAKIRSCYVVAHSIFLRKNLKTSLRPGVLIIDEIHHYRNPDTVSFSNLINLSLSAKWRVGLTATPINNTLDDLIAEINIILPQYSRVTIEEAVKEVWFSKKTRLLHPILTRFEKRALGIHFARRVVSNMQVSYPREYLRLVTDTIKDLRGREPGSQTIQFDEITLYRTAASSPAAFLKASGMKPSVTFGADPKLTLLHNLLQHNRSSQVLIFCEFKETVGYLSRHVEDRPVFSITGETPFVDRHGILRNFQNSGNGVMLMTAVGSEGLDFQFCSRLVNYDLHWNPMILEQRIGRVDRIGQEKNEVEIFNIVVDGSIDERVWRVLSKKLAAIDQSVFAPQPILYDTEIPTSNSMSFAIDKFAQIEPTNKNSVFY